MSQPTPAYEAAILVPTYDRPVFLARQLQYLSAHFDPARLKILVLDGSQQHAEENRRLCEGLPVSYHHYPDPELLFWNRMLDGLDKIADVPVAIVADDDLLDPDGFWQCVRLLRDKPAYAVAHGQYLGFREESDRNIALYEIYKHGPSCEQDCALSRLFELMSRFSPLVYAVHQKAVMQAAMTMIRDAIDADDPYMYELLGASVAAVSGKIKKFDTFYMARQAGYSATSFRIELDQYLVDPRFSNRYQRFKTKIHQRFRETNAQSTLPDAPLNQGIDWAFNGYVARIITPLRMKNRFTVLKREMAKVHAVPVSGKRERPGWMNALRHPKSLFKRKPRFKGAGHQRMLHFLQRHPVSL